MSLHLHSQFQENPQPQPATNPWPYYAIRTKSNREFVTHASFLGKGFDSYLPTYYAARTRNGRASPLEVPLFSGYVFCRFDFNRRQPILITPGVFQIVSTNGYPCPVDDQEIAAIQAVTRSGIPTQPWPFLVVGRRVRITDGPLRGLEGPVLHCKGAFRLIVGLSLLQRALSVEIDRHWIQPL